MMKWYKYILVFLCFFSTKLLAQDSVLTIGIKEAPPFVQWEEGKNYEGLSFDFFDLVAQDIPAEIRFEKFENVQDLINAVEKGKVDMSINPITVTDARMLFLDFSQPFFISGTTMVRQKPNTWWVVLKNIFSWQFFSAVAALLFVIFVFGFVMWLFERKRNPEQFKKGWAGIGDGFWWSAVTMTTVGYGDKAPVTRAGRFVGLVWMFAAILMISGLTAGIASALTVSTLSEKIRSVEDLRNFKVATIEGSSTDQYLKIFGVNAVAFNDVEEALDAVENNKIDALVYDRPLLQYYLNKGAYENLVLHPQDFKTDYYSFSFPKKNKLKTTIDPLVIRQLKSSDWNYKLTKLKREK